MALNEAVRAGARKKIERYEGRIPHLYLDSAGRVTVGIGHLVASRGAVKALELHVAEKGVAGRAATDKEKLDDYDSVAKQRKGYRASWYKKHAKLVMKEAVIDALCDEHILSFHKELQRIYREKSGYPADFDALPTDVQLALFDMIFNLGATKVVKVFTKFDAAVKAADWAEAAKQSNRPQLAADRNAYVKALLEAAAAAVAEAKRAGAASAGGAAGADASAVRPRAGGGSL